jgi:2-polyprenyl-3-methyl-5-hydroxy-6-metoxy-1,4-benzoquinol methylase
MEQKELRTWEQCYSNPLYWEWEDTPPEWSWTSTVGFWEWVLHLEKGAKVLDLGCAMGWYTLELARRGYDATGLEWSEHSLTEAKRRMEQVDVPVRFIRGDMTQMTFKEEFDAVVLWGNTFGMFSHDENVQTLRGIQRALKPGGQILIDTQNYMCLPEKLERGWGFHGLEKKLLFLAEGTRSVTKARFGFNVLAIDFATGKRHIMPLSWRLYLVPELKQMVQDTGLDLLGIYGDDPQIVDWSKWKKGEAFPYSIEGFTDQAAKRILLCRRTSG